MGVRIVLYSLRLLTFVLFAICPLLRAAERPYIGRVESANIRSFLQNYLQDSHTTRDTMTRYVAALVDLEDAGERQVIVHFTDQHSCGSGGCTTLILAPEGRSYKVITSITIGWPPIRVLHTKTNGWHDLGIWVRGGGIQQSYEADLPFNGTTYPRNPSVFPARPLVEKVAGKIVIPKGTVGLPLY